MGRILKGRRPSPAMIISVIALIVAVGGSTFAIAASDNKKDKKIASKVVTKRAPSLSVLHAKTADSATSATNTGHASTADTASIGQSPLLYAHVNADGTVDAANSRGITNANVVNDPDNTGSYCFIGLSGAKTAMVVADGANAEDASLQVGSGSGLCASVSGTQFRVATDDGSGTFPDLPFFIWFAGP